MPEVYCEDDPASLGSWDRGDGGVEEREEGEELDDRGGTGPYSTQGVEGVEARVGMGIDEEGGWRRFGRPQGRKGRHQLRECYLGRRATDLRNMPAFPLARA